MLSTPNRESEHDYFKFFEDNWNNITNIWKRIKSIIIFKNFLSNVSCTLLTLSVNDITLPVLVILITTLTNTSPVIKKTRENINYSHKNYYDYLNDKCRIFYPP